MIRRGAQLHPGIVPKRSAGQTDPYCAADDVTRNMVVRSTRSMLAVCEDCAATSCKEAPRCHSEVLTGWR
jgi:hypothetical protein